MSCGFGVVGVLAGSLYNQTIGKKELKKME